MIALINDLKSYHKINLAIDLKATKGGVTPRLIKEILDRTAQDSRDKRAKTFPEDLIREHLEYLVAEGKAMRLVGEDEEPRYFPGPR